MNILYIHLNLVSRWSIVAIVCTFDPFRCDSICLLHKIARISYKFDITTVAVLVEEKNFADHSPYALSPKNEQKPGCGYLPNTNAL